MRNTLLLCLALLLPATALAAEAPQPKPGAPAAEAPPPPPLRSTEAAPAPGDTGLEPEVTITTRGELTHEEYRLHGRLYMIKVIPKRGKPYYLVDREGSGQFQRSDFESRLSIPQWVIKSW
jgi:hypothetical protein